MLQFKNKLWIELKQISDFTEFNDIYQTIPTCEPTRNSVVYGLNWSQLNKVIWALDCHFKTNINKYN